MMYLTVFVTSFVLVASVWAIFGDWMKYFRLSKSGQWTSGVRIGDGRIAVEHWISKNGYLTETGFLNSQFNSKDTVAIVYLPTNPQIACACDPHESLRNLTYTIALWSSLVALLVTFGYHHFRKDYWDE